MKLNWKLIGIGAGALFGVLVLAVVLFIAFFPKDLAAAEAERRIEEATGRDLVLGGDVEISFWPALGFSVQNVSLSNPADFDQPARRGGVEEAQTPFIAADRIVFAVAVLPLLRGDIEVKTLIFEGAEVRLREKEDGTANWTFPADEENPEQLALEDLRLDDVRLINSLITFESGDSAAPLTLEDVNATLALESLDQAAQLEADFTYRGERLDVDAEVGAPRAVLEKGVTPITLNVASALLDASFNGDFNAETGALAGAIDANGSSLRRVLAWIGSPMAEGGGFGAFRLGAQMAREGQTTALTDAAVRLDDITANGALTLVQQQNDRLRIDGSLNAQRVNLNTYLPAPAQAGSESGIEVDNSWSTNPLDLSGLRALDANLALGVGELQFQRMQFSNVQMALRIANGAADARLTRVSLYSGAGTARLIADGSGAVPRIAFELNADNIQAEPLLRDAIGFDKITGRGRLVASLVGTGASQAAIMRSLRGSASFNFNDGQWKGFNLAQIARTIQSVATGQAAGQGGATDFAELSSTFTVADGVAATDNLRLLNPYVRLEGAGVIDIGAQTIDMRIAPRAVNSAQGQGGDAAIAGLGIPFRVTGPWSRVSFRPALEDIVQNQLRDVLGQRQEGSPLEALSGILFGRQPAQAPAETPAETPAQSDGGETPAETPAQQPQQERPRNPLEDIFRRAIEGDRQQQEQAAPGP